MTNELDALLDQDANGKASNAEAAREFNVLEIKAKIAELNTLILSAHPTMPILLRDIHTQIRRDPELVTVISEEEIGMIVNGLKVQTNTALVTQTVKSAKSAATKKALSKISADDL
jgi:hypothetical protein